MAHRVRLLLALAARPLLAPDGGGHRLSVLSLRATGIGVGGEAMTPRSHRLLLAAASLAGLVAGFFLVVLADAAGWVR